MGDDDEQEEESEKEKEQEKEKDDAEVPKRYWYEKKAKLVKKKAKTHKMVKEMCYYLIEKYDEWMHEKQKEIALIMKEGDKLEEHFEPISFCREGNVCKEAMFATNVALVKFKRELKMPKKPKRKWEPPVLTDYDEQMEDDVEGEEAEDSEKEESEETAANDKSEKSEL